MVAGGRSAQGMFGGAIAALAVSAIGHAAVAQEFCVRCDAPVAVYRCIIDHGSPQGITLKAMCTGMLEHDGKHAACRVADGTVFDCDGPKRRIDARVAGPLLTKGAMPSSPAAAPSAEGLKAPAAPGATSEASGSPSKVAAPVAKPAAAVIPKPVEQPVKQSGKSTSDVLDKVGEGANKAWRCISSAFQLC